MVKQAVDKFFLCGVLLHLVVYNLSGDVEGKRAHLVSELLLGFLLLLGNLELGIVHHLLRARR